MPTLNVFRSFRRQSDGDSSNRLDDLHYFTPGLKLCDRTAAIFHFAKEFSRAWQSRASPRQCLPEKPPSPSQSTTLSSSGGDALSQLSFLRSRQNREPPFSCPQAV